MPTLSSPDNYTFHTVLVVCEHVSTDHKIFRKLRKMLWQMKHDNPCGMAADVVYYQMSHDCRCDVMLHDGIRLVIVNTGTINCQAVHLKRKKYIFKSNYYGSDIFSMTRFNSLSCATFYLAFSFETSRLMHVISQVCMIPLNAMKCGLVVKFCFHKNICVLPAKLHISIFKGL